jgi:hypothetical protein
MIKASATSDSHPASEHPISESIEPTMEEEHGEGARNKDQGRQEQ